jgi:hypothetical protein
MNHNCNSQNHIKNHQNNHNFFTKSTPSSQKPFFESRGLRAGLDPCRGPPRAAFAAYVLRPPRGAHLWPTAYVARGLHVAPAASASASLVGRAFLVPYKGDQEM